MAGPNLEAFERALSRFRRTLPSKRSREFSICTVEDVRQEIRKIQNEQGAQGKLRYLSRVGGFIEAMEQLGAVLDLFVNANELVCFIWVRAVCRTLKVSNVATDPFQGPLKLLLGVSVELSNFNIPLCSQRTTDII